MNIDPQASRRSLVRGAAWVVPIVAVSSIAPAFAASASSSCVPVTWKNTSTSVLVGVMGDECVAITYAASGNYASAGTACGYTEKTITKDGNLVLATTVKRGSSAKTGYYSVKMRFPAQENGPFSFVITNIDSCADSRSTKTNVRAGGLTFIDRVVVLVDGVAVTPSSASGVQVSGTTVTAKGQAGSAAYTVSPKSTIEIRLSNAYTGQLCALPAQAILISPLSCEPVEAPTEDSRTSSKGCR